MQKKDWQPVYDSIRPFIEDAARTQYTASDLEAGFKFWAVSQVLMDMGLTEDQIAEPLLLDGKGDLSIDGYYEDDEAESLILVQSKYHVSATAIGNDDINRFFSALRKVLDPDVVVRAGNPLAQDAHRAAKDAIAKGWTIRFIFLTSGYLSPDGRTFAEKMQSEVETIDSVQVRKELEVLDVEGLKARYDSYLTSGTYNTDVVLTIPTRDRHVSKIGNFSVLVAALPASELVKAFRQHKYALFRLNPRGPLQNKTNANIRKTILDPVKRKWFYHLNNGITALADEFKEQGEEVAIRGFQIVNGCQTTVSLDKVRSIVDDDPDIKILLRLFEGVTNFRNEIADATNTQARLAAQDKKSNEPLQEDLRKRFDALPEPIFYEKKRGDWQVLQSAGTQGRYFDKATGTYRRIGMADLSQAILAFLGEPGRAKDRRRDIFEDDSLYQRVFPAGLRPEQALLPWSVYRLCEDACKKWTATFKGAQYARFCLTAIVGSEFCPAGTLPSVRESQRLAHNEEAIQAVIKRGQQAIASVIAVDEYPGPREFFRSPDFFDKILRTYRLLPTL